LFYLWEPGRNLVDRLGQKIDVQNKTAKLMCKKILPHPRVSGQKEESGPAGIVGGHHRVAGGVRPGVAAETGSRDDETA
jgi:hypothetical protein